MLKVVTIWNVLTVNNTGYKYWYYRSVEKRLKCKVVKVAKTDETLWICESYEFDKNMQIDQKWQKYTKWRKFPKVGRMGKIAENDSS